MKHKTQQSINQTSDQVDLNTFVNACLRLKGFAAAPAANYYYYYYYHYYSL